MLEVREWLLELRGHLLEVRKWLTELREHLLEVREWLLELLGHPLDVQDKERKLKAGDSSRQTRKLDFSERLREEKTG